MLDLFVTGTVPKVGKTLVSAGLAATMQGLGYGCALFKPIQTDAIEENGFSKARDLNFIKKIDAYIKTYFTYMFSSKEPACLAFEENGVVMNKAVIKNDFINISKSLACTIVEGNGCAMTPIAPEFCTLDLAKYLNLPVLFVTSGEETSVSSVLSVLNVANSLGINVRGVIINNVNPENVALKEFPRLIEEYSDAKILGVLPHFVPEKLGPNDLITSVLNGIDIESVFDVKISKLSLD